MTQRVAISLIALYALVLQSFASAAAPTVFAALDGSICAQDISGSQAPAGEGHHDHGPCCILACVACACAYVATASGLAIFPASSASPLSWALDSAIAARPPVKYYFAARGPPQRL